MYSLHVQPTYCTLVTYRVHTNLSLFVLDTESVNVASEEPRLGIDMLISSLVIPEYGSRYSALKWRGNNPD